MGERGCVLFVGFLFAPLHGKVVPLPILLVPLLESGYSKSKEMNKNLCGRFFKAAKNFPLMLFQSIKTSFGIP